MKIVRFPNLVNGAPWGLGSSGIRNPESGQCRRCGWPGRRKPSKSSLVGLVVMANGMYLCSTCARRTLAAAMGRPFDADELAAIRAGRASTAVPMTDAYAQLYA